MKIRNINVIQIFSDFCRDYTGKTSLKNAARSNMCKPNYNNYISAPSDREFKLYKFTSSAMKCQRKELTRK